jgi:hypothetical protein
VPAVVSATKRLLRDLDEDSSPLSRRANGSLTADVYLRNRVLELRSGLCVDAATLKKELSKLPNPIQDVSCELHNWFERKKMP